MSAFRRLSRPALMSLAAAFETGRVSVDSPSSSLARYVPSKAASRVAQEVASLAEAGMSPKLIAHTLRLLAEERATTQEVADQVELVWSGRRSGASPTRDTAVVVQELFGLARKSLLIASYALDSGPGAQRLFKGLAARMDDAPQLQVRLFVNVGRRHPQDDTPSSELLRHFAENFRDERWPGIRLPAVFHDPRSLEVGGTERACLHAKCVVADETHAFVSSANFTEAAHARNIEAGVLVRDSQVARSLVQQFEGMLAEGRLVRVPGLG